MDSWLLPLFDDKAIHQAFQDAGHRLTSHRLALLNVLRHQGGFLDAEALHELANLRGANLSLATVYRTLALFKELNLVEGRIVAGDPRVPLPLAAAAPADLQALRRHRAGRVGHRGRVPPRGDCLAGCQCCRPIPASSATAPPARLCWPEAPRSEPELCGAPDIILSAFLRSQETPMQDEPYEEKPKRGLDDEPLRRPYGRLPGTAPAPALAVRPGRGLSGSMLSLLRPADRRGGSRRGHVELDYGIRHRDRHADV